ncbi:hypothetical protein B484DRAFT_417149, partial [Ochromonadaceae sp. CCMP2298]
TALLTPFEINTVQWTDEDIPLSYVFSYYVLSVTDQYALKSLDNVATATSLLGQGLASNDFAVTIVACALDLYAAETTATTTSRVLQVAASKALQKSTALALTVALQ